MNDLFVPFPKMARLSRPCTISEKLDGTNASITITEDELRLKLEEVAKDRDNLKACWDYSIAERVRLQKSTAKDRGEARTALQDLQRLKNEVQAAMNRHSSQLSDILRGVGKEVAE